MHDLTVPKATPGWLRIVQYPPVRLGIFGTIMFYMLGFSNNFLGQAAGQIWVQIAILIGWSAAAFAVYSWFVRLVERRPVTELALPGMGRDASRQAG